MRLSAELVGQLTEALESLAGDPSVRVVKLTGAGNVFCAGADIGEMRAAGAAASTDQNEADSRRFALMLESLETTAAADHCDREWRRLRRRRRAHRGLRHRDCRIERAVRALRSPARA